MGDWDDDMADLRGKADEFFGLLYENGATCCQLKNWVNQIVHLSIEMKPPRWSCQLGTPGCGVAHEHNWSWSCE